MKFVVSIVHKEDAPALVDRLVTSGFRVTTWNTTGGFLREESVTLFSGVADEHVDDLVRLIQDNCRTRTQHVGSLPSVMASGETYVLETEEAKMGGTVIFVLDVAQFLKA
jgi:uncharacterized protein YaaQ